MERSKLYKILGIIVGVIVLIILLIVIFTLVNGNKISYSDVEAKIKEATKEYYTAHVDLLPEAGRSSTVSAAVLANEGYMDSLDEMIKKTKCEGTGKVFNNGMDYVYSSSLTCGSSYNSLSAIDYLISKNEIKVDGSGLYEETVAYPSISEEGKVTDYIYNATVGETTRYVYKGSNPNNQLKIDGSLFYIVSFNEQEIKVIKPVRDYTTFDDSYNEQTNLNDGKNVYNTSDLLSSLGRTYGELTEKVRSYTIPHSVCIGERLENELSINGSVECKKVLINQKYSLLSAYEVLSASADPNCLANTKSCANSNYIDNLGSTWTVTPLAGTTNYEFVSAGELMPRLVSRSTSYLLILTFDPNVKISGSGSENEPFVIG